MSSSHSDKLSQPSSEYTNEKQDDTVHPEKLGCKQYASVTSNEGSTTVEMGSDRPGSVMGPQGDHSSAYALFKHLVLAAVESLSLEEATKVVLSIIDSYIPNANAQLIFDRIKPELEKYTNGSLPWLKELKEKNVSEETINYLLNTIKDLYLSQMLSELISLHLELRNHLDSTCFPTDGLSIQPPKDEGSKVRKAISDLKKLDYEEKSGFSNERKPLSENEAIQKIVTSMLDLIWYPKVPDADLAILSNEEHWKKIVKKKGYRSETKPRSNDEEILCNVIFNHLVLIHDVFPQFSGREGLRRKINEEFLSKMLSEKSDFDLSWKFSPDEYNRIKDRILKDLELRHDYTPASSRRSRYSNSETTTSEELKKELSSGEDKQSSNETSVDLDEDQSSNNDLDWHEEANQFLQEETNLSSSIKTRTQSDKSDIDSTHLQSFKKK